MKKRCYLTSCDSYSHYGGRGIKVCEERKENYENFSNWAKTNGYQENLSIDRIDANKDYCPENC